MIFDMGANLHKYQTPIEIMAIDLGYINKTAVFAAVGIPPKMIIKHPVDTSGTAKIIRALRPKPDFKSARWNW